MNVRDKRFLWFSFGAFCSMCITAALLCAVDGCTAGRTENRIDKYAERSADAERNADRIQQRLGELEEQMQSAGNETAECITKLGELEADCDRLAEAGRGIAVTADGIEERILICLQILGTPEEDDEILEGNSSGLYDPGGN